MALTIAPLWPSVPVSPEGPCIENITFLLARDPFPSVLPSPSTDTLGLHLTLRSQPLSPPFPTTVPSSSLPLTPPFPSDLPSSPPLSAGNSSISICSRAPKGAIETMWAWLACVSLISGGSSWPCHTNVPLLSRATIDTISPRSARPPHKSLHTRTTLLSKGARNSIVSRKSTLPIRSRLSSHARRTLWPWGARKTNTSILSLHKSSK